eukprot:IDg6673t1
MRLWSQFSCRALKDPKMTVIPRACHCMVSNADQNLVVFDLCTNAIPTLPRLLLPFCSTVTVVYCSGNRIRSCGRIPVSELLLGFRAVVLQRHLVLLLLPHFDWSAEVWTVECQRLEYFYLPFEGCIELAEPHLDMRLWTSVSGVVPRISNVSGVTKHKVKSAVGGRCSLRVVLRELSRPLAALKYIGSICNWDWAGLYEFMPFCSFLIF